MMTRALSLVLVALLLSRPVVVQAQDQPAVFVHGFGADGSDWTATANRLRETLAIEPRVPTLSWRRHFDEQANELQASLSDASESTVVIGHSNGGVVAREWSRQRPLSGIVTIGTPHRGTPLVSRFYQWAGFHEATPYLLNGVLSAFSVSNNSLWVYAFVEEALNWISDFSIWSVVGVATVFGFDQALPVASQLMPSSQYFSQLNSSDNLAREAAAVPNRVGIISIAHNFYWAGPARAVVPGSADDIAVAMYAAASGLVFWGTYIAVTSPADDIAALEQSMSILSVAGHLLSVDPFYCAMISRTDMSACRPNDGIVPDESQRYPGAPNLLIGGNNQGPAHTQERDQSDEAFREALFWYLHVPERTGPPPDPPPGYEPPPAPGSAGTLVAGRSLRPGQSQRSPDGRFNFTFQTDGNLVLYSPWDVPMWASHTLHPAPGVLLMQTDGNLVMYDARHRAVWATDTHRNPGSYLAVQNNGDVVLYNAEGSPLWRTGTGS